MWRSHARGRLGMQATACLDVGVRDGRIVRGQKLLLEGIGGGFAWGAVLVDY